MRPTRSRQISSYRSSSAAAARMVSTSPRTIRSRPSLLHDEPGPFEHGDVPLHRGEGHRVALGESGHRCLGRHDPGDDVAAGAVGECPEDPVDLVVVDLRIYNHIVVRYAGRPS